MELIRRREGWRHTSDSMKLFFLSTSVTSVINVGERISVKSVAFLHGDLQRIFWHTATALV
jgi:hypothetical protein